MRWCKLPLNFSKHRTGISPTGVELCNNSGRTSPGAMFRTDAGREDRIHGSVLTTPKLELDVAIRNRLATTIMHAKSGACVAE